MFCNRCGAQARTGQRFCAECGAPLDGSTNQPPTEPIDVVGDAGPTASGATASRSAADRPPPPSERTQPIEVITPDLPPTQSFDAIPADEPSGDDTVTNWADERSGPPETTPPAHPDAAPDGETEIRAAVPRLYDLALDEPDLLHDPAPAPVTTQQMPSPTTFPATDELPVASERLLDTDDTLLGRFRIGTVSGVGIVAGMTALFGVFLPLVGIRTDASSPSFATGTWGVADVATNLPGALIVILVALLVGVVGAGFRQRWAAGLAGGAGLALAGWSALVVGLAERPVEAAFDAVSRPTAEAFTVTVTRDVGYWILLAAGILGIVTFVVSLASGGRDPARRGLNPWIASLGAVAAVIAAAGPLLPEGAAAVHDNWSPGSGGLGQPTWYVIGRLGQLGLLAYTGVIGFLLVRSYGLGLVIGGLTASMWLALTTLLGLGDAPVGPGVRNPGSTGPVELHAVTIVGMTALVGMVVVAVIAAVEQSVREHR